MDLNKKINLEDVQMNTQYVRCPVCDDLFKYDAEKDLCPICEENVEESMSDFYLDSEE